MHGDEPTATMALMDVFNFFNNKNGFAELKKSLLDNLTIHFIPMLNPDGAERFQRRNAIGVDLNRDALRTTCPEAYILKHIRDSLQADWGFNLHDQNRYYAAGLTDHTASISFLAPAYNYEKNINRVRGNAMKLIAVMNGVLQKYIPNKIGRYSDDFEPRAFGDNITKWGTSTILIESGGLKGDPEKQELRKLHFVVLLTAFESIANGSFNKEKIESYNKIPFNESNVFHDFIVRKANIEHNGQPFTIDIAFRNDERDYDNHRRFYTESSIRDIGDLSTVHGYGEWDASAYTTLPGKVFPKIFHNIAEFKKQGVLSILNEGYTDIQLEEMPPIEGLPELPFNIVPANTAPPANNISLWQNPSLIFEKNGKIFFVLVNGKLFDLKKDAGEISRVFDKI